MSAVSGETKWNIFLHDFWVSALFSEQNLIFFPTTVTRKMSKSNACMIFKQTKYSKTQSNQFRKDFLIMFLNNRAQTTGSWLCQQTWCEVEEGSRGFLKMGWLCFWQKLYHWIKIFDQRGFWPIHLYSGCTTRSGMPRIGSNKYTDDAEMSRILH